MYETYQRPVRILLYERGGSIYHYINYEEFIKETSWLKIGDGPNDTYWGDYQNWDFSGIAKHYYDLWAKDEFGNSISKDTIYNSRHKEKELRYPNTVYRKDPVPGTKGRGGKYRWYKRPKTTQEMREYYKIVVEEEDTGYPVHHRARRSPHNLPQSWDDKVQTDWKNHSWKEFRKTQYK